MEVVYLKFKPSALINAINLRKYKWLWILSIPLLIGVIFGIFYLYEQINRLPPAEIVKQGLENTIHAQNYRFRVTARRTFEGKDAVLSDIYGEKNSQGVHLKGVLPIIKAEVELYHVGDKIYRSDPITKKWVVVPAGGRVAIEQLISELNPLQPFNFQENQFDVKYTGKEKIDGKTCYVYEVMTRGENKYLELFWRDFNYIIWLDKKENYIRQAKITAEHRDNSRHSLSILLRLANYNEEIDIKPPLVKTNME
jgi:hypothetical protein